MSDASCHAPTYTGAKRAFHGDPPLVELAHPDRIAAAFRAMNSGDQRALQGESSTPVITPTSLELAGECRVVREKKMEMVKAVMPTAEMVENLTSCMSLENVSNNDLHEDPTVFLAGGLTSSKHSQTSGRGSLNVTTTRWTQRSERNTGSHSLTLPNSSESMKGSRDDSSGTAQTISSGDCGGFVLLRCTNEQPISSSSGCGACPKMEKSPCEGDKEAAAGSSNAPTPAHTSGAACKGNESHGHHNRERGAGGTVTATQGAAQAPLSGDPPPPPHTHGDRALAPPRTVLDIFF
nr:unnamed protein product [Leishmania braziliensis]